GRRVDGTGKVARSGRAKRAISCPALRQELRPNPTSPFGAFVVRYGMRQTGRYAGGRVTALPFQQSRGHRGGRLARMLAALVALSLASGDLATLTERT